MHASETNTYVTGDQDLLRDSGAGDFIRPAWSLMRKRRNGWVTNDLLVWCDECLQWSCLGLCEEEQVAGYIAERCQYCECRIAGATYCMGMAEGELAKMLQRYPSKRMKHTPPPVRRVYPVVAVEKEAVCP
jgi:hypothetical protein